MTKKKAKPPIKATKKEAIAKATVRPGTGVVRINSRLLKLVQPESVRTFIEEPIMIAGPIADQFNVAVSVQGGGQMSQAVAARACLAKAYVEYGSDKALRKKMIEYDRMLLVDDPRRTEPKKPLGPKARRKKQHSKR